MPELWLKARLRTLGMIVSNLENPFFFDIFRTVENNAHAQGYEVVVHTEYRPEQLAAKVRNMLERRRACHHCFGNDTGAHTRTGGKQNSCWFSCGTRISHSSIFNIHVNYRRGMERIVNYLHSLGHNRLAFVGHHSTLGPTGNSVLSKRCRASFEQQMADGGQPRRAGGRPTSGARAKLGLSANGNRVC